MKKLWCKLFHWKHFELHRGVQGQTVITLMMCDKCEYIHMVTEAYGKHHPEWLTECGKGLNKCVQQ